MDEEELKLAIININNDNTIIFSINVSEWDGFEFKQSKEMLKINEEGFFVEGKKIKDINNVYSKFSKWISCIN